jgi:hypothetical protein
MVMETANGLLVTTSSIAVIEAINHFHAQILSSGLYAGDIIAAARDHPDNLLIQSYAGAFYLFAQEHDATKISEAYLHQAVKISHGTNERERLTFKAVRAWSCQDYESAITLFSAIATLYTPHE